MSKQTFEVGTLLIRYHSGETAIVTETAEDRLSEYGNVTEKRRIYRLYTHGAFFWMRDIEVRAKYRRA